MLPPLKLGMYVYGVVDPESPEREKEEVKDRIGAMLISPLFLKAVWGEITRE